MRNASGHQAEMSGSEKHKSEQELKQQNFDEHKRQFLHKK